MSVDTAPEPVFVSPDNSDQAQIAPEAQPKTREQEVAEQMEISLRRAQAEAVLNNRRGLRGLLG